MSVRGELPAAPALRANLDRQLIDTLPSESASAGLSSLVTLTVPGVAADSNGGFHPLGEHAEASFSIDGQPITDQQSRTFSNQLSTNAIESLEVETGVPSPEYGDKTSLIAKVVTRSGLGIRRPSGTISVALGSFTTPTASFTLGAGSPRIGNFVALDGLRSDRFLDAPESVALHDRGSVYNLFDRVDAALANGARVSVNASAAQSAFETPNTFDQEASGQDQRQRQRSVNLAPSVTRVLGSRTLVEINGWGRRDVVTYAGSAAPFADRPAVLTQGRTLSNAGAKAVLTFTSGAHVLRAGVQGTSTGLSEHFKTGLTDPAFNAPCLSADGSPDPDVSLRARADCAAARLAANPAFVAGLAPYDLTRGGALFTFDGRGRVNQWAAFAQDTVAAGPVSATVGARVDVYRGLSDDASVQPRASLSYRTDRTRTVWRASYGRIFLTPYNENLVLASSTGTGGILGSVGASPLVPGVRNQFDVGFQQQAWRGIRIDGEYFWKFTDGAFDFDIILNTPLAFPVQFRKSAVDGGLARITLPETRGWQAYVTLSHTKALLYGPELGGLRFSADYAPVARPDHDEAFQSNTHVEYRRRDRLGFWAGVTWRYDSGLVAVAVPTYADALRLTGDEQAAMGLYCGNVPATRDQPLRACGAASFGAARIDIPAPGTENDATNPPRIVPRHLFDVAVGVDRLHAGRVPLRVRATVVNLLDTIALYNFLSTFSGTHFVTPRALQLQVTVPF